MASTIYDECYLVMSEYGIQRMTKRAGGLKRGEVSVKVRMVMPISAFADPDVSAVITVPESAVIKPAVRVEVIDPPVEEQSA